MLARRTLIRGAVSSVSRLAQTQKSSINPLQRANRKLFFSFSSLSHVRQFNNSAWLKTDHKTIDINEQLEVAAQEKNEAKQWLRNLQNRVTQGEKGLEERLKMAETTYLKSMDIYEQVLDQYNNAKNTNTSTRSLLPFQFDSDVKRRLVRPLDEWQECESFDVTGLRQTCRVSGWNDVMFVPSASLSLLRTWEQDAERGKEIVAYGSPGIGKSALAQLCVVRSLLLGDPVFVHYKGDNVLLEYDEEEGGIWRTPLSTSRQAALDMADLPKKDMVIVYDSPVGFQKTFDDARDWKRAMVVHSPSADINNSFKAKLHMHLVEPPTLDELIELGRIEGIAEATVRERVHRFGNSFRAVASNHDDFERNVQQGIHTLVQSGVDGLEAINSSPREVHRLLKWTMVENEEVFSFASEHLADAVVARVAAKSRHGLLSLANTVDLHGALRGQVFENRMHDVFASAESITVKARQEGEDDVEERSLTCTERVHYGFSAPLADTIHTNTYYQPIAKNNPSYDAFFIDNDTKTLWLIQYTVALKHDIKVKGLKEVEKMMEKKKILDANGNEISNVKQCQLVFIVPPVVFEQIELPQRLVNEQKKETNVDFVEKQHVWCIDRVNNEQLWP